MARSLTVGPLPSDQVARLLRSYRELAKERADLEALLVKLAPGWGQAASHGPADAPFSPQARITPDLWRSGVALGRVRVGRIAPGRTGGKVGAKAETVTRDCCGTTASARRVSRAVEPDRRLPPVATDRPQPAVSARELGLDALSRLSRWRPYPRPRDPPAPTRGLPPSTSTVPSTGSPVCGWNCRSRR